jgi:hypothetical protein
MGRQTEQRKDEGRMANEKRRSQPGGEVPAQSCGLPAVRIVRLEPLRLAIECLEALARDIRGLDDQCPKWKTLAYAVRVMREAVVEGARHHDMLSPGEVVAKLKDELRMEISPDTIRNWCNADDVSHEKSRSGRYLVDYDSVLAFVARGTVA